MTNEQAENFIQEMKANAIPQAEYITNKYNFENHNILDIGAGAGTYLITLPYDYNNDFPNGLYADVFLFAVVHQEPKENLKRLLNNIYNILKPNGRLFLTSFFLNNDKISPEFSVQFAIEMLASSQNGKVYTHSEITDLLKDCNFSNIERIDKIPSSATCI